MGNVFPSDKDVHTTYDLKGSTHGRRTSAQEISRNPQAVLKDLNWVDASCLLELGPLKQKDFIEQLHRDVEVRRYRMCMHRDASVFILTGHIISC